MRILLAFLLLASTTVFADGYLVASESLLALDWAQTRYISTHPDTYQELNPLLGSHPSIGRVNTHFAGAMLADWAIGDWLRDEFGDDSRKTWLIAVSVVEGSVVAHNYRIGVRFNF